MAATAVPEPAVTTASSVKPADDGKCEHGSSAPDCCIKCLENSSRNMAKKIAVLRMQQQPANENVKCNGCNRINRPGHRYTCTVCTDLDFCQECNDKDVHIDHAMVQLKFRDQKAGDREYNIRRSSNGYLGMVLQ